MVRHLTDTTKTPKAPRSQRNVKPYSRHFQGSCSCSGAAPLRMKKPLLQWGWALARAPMALRKNRTNHCSYLSELKVLAFNDCFT